MLSEPAPYVKPLTHSSLRGQAADALRALVATGNLTPGKIYPIGPVAAHLQVSATPVREALLDMAKDGVVEVIRGRGFRIPIISQQDLIEIFQLRRDLLEDYCMRAIESAPADELDATLLECRAVNEKAKVAAAQHDFGSFSSADRQMHLSLVALAHNRRLVEIVGRLRDSTLVYGHSPSEISDYMLTTTRQYDDLFDALRDRRFVDASKISREHLDTVEEIWGRAAMRLAAESVDKG